MKKLVILLGVFVLAGAGLYAYQIYSSKYFIEFTGEQAAQFLEKFDMKSCEEYQDAYLNKEDAKGHYLQTAMAYDFGICTDQDLKKAAEMYEKELSHYGDLTSSIRLAVIYNYGPHTIRNYNRASFLYKQVAIHLAGFTQNWSRPQINEYIRAHLYKGKIPAKLVRELDWVMGVMKKPFSERKRIGHTLEEEGFKATFSLSEPLERQNKD